MIIYNFYKNNIRSEAESFCKKIFTKYVPKFSIYIVGI